MVRQPAKVHRVGYIASTAPVSDLVGANPNDPVARAFVQGLRELGYVEGKNLVVEWRAAEGRSERMPELVAELVGLKVDVLLAGGSPVALAAKKTTGTI